MNARLALAATMLIGSLIGGVVAASHAPPDDLIASAAQPVQVSMLECAAGYHSDRFGNCEPDNGIVDSRCGTGLEAAPSPSASGYRCIPIPEGY